MDINETEHKIEVVDINKLIPKKKGRPAGKKAPAKKEKETLTPDQKVSEKEKLKEELLHLADFNESVITKPINDKVANLVEEMSIEELKSRIRYAKRNQSSKMDNSVADQAIILTNQLMGNLMGCLDELNESSMKDQLLKESLKEYMCINVLDFIPLEVKLAGIYSSHLGSAYYKAQEKKTPNITEINNKTITKDEIKRKMDDPEFKNKLDLLKEKLKGFTPPEAIKEKPEPVNIVEIDY